MDKLLGLVCFLFEFLFQEDWDRMVKIDVYLSILRDRIAQQSACTTKQNNFWGDFIILGAYLLILSRGFWKYEEF